MSTKNRWLIRIAFWLFMLYIYLTVYSRGGTYSFLLLNTFLGYLPIELSFHLDYRQNNFIFGVIFVFWLLFYPNAPYVLTDLFHLAKLDPYNSATGLMEFNLHLWLNFSNLVASALACSLVGIWSLEYVADQLLLKLHRFSRGWQILTINILLLLSSVGIYVGRFLRLHTAYLFLDPNWVLQQLVDMWSPRMLIFVGFMFIIQLIMWIIIFISRQSLQQTEKNMTEVKQN